MNHCKSGKKHSENLYVICMQRHFLRKKYNFSKKEKAHNPFIYGALRAIYHNTVYTCDRCHMVLHIGVSDSTLWLLTALLSFREHSTALGNPI